MGNSEDGCFVFLVSFFVLIPLAWAGHALTVLINWNWFMPSLGIARIGFWQAAGIDLLVTSFMPTPKFEKNSDKPGPAVTKAFVTVVARCVFTLAMGYGIHAALVG